MEITSLRGETSETYALPNGDFEAVEHLRPVRARVDDAWKAIDTALEKRADGSIAPKAATVGIAFSGGGKKQPLITLERAGRKLSLSWPTALPEPVIDGDTATYPSVLKDVDLRVKASVDGASEVLVVKTPVAAADPRLAELRLAMDADGMDVRTTPDGGLAAVRQGRRWFGLRGPAADDVGLQQGRVDRGGTHGGREAGQVRRSVARARRVRENRAHRRERPLE